ncbi:MAG TPA: suppressor of fused domain protein [Phycisphaerae bacterium]|nr:suppressor of fused domain protein [Phycisphaerae bacterium]
MENIASEWLEALQARFGEISQIKHIESEGKPKVFVFYFDGWPEPGLMTAVTFGLSNANHPDWKYGGVELMVSLETQDRSWGLSAAYFASAFFNERPFAYGDIFMVDDPISDESEMNAYLVFGPPFLEQADAQIDLSDRSVFLKGMYPLYESELDQYERLGLEDFWRLDELDILNPRRRPVQT